MTRDLRPLFDPRSVAILGASAHPSKWGYWLARGALAGRGRRDVYLVNRRGEAILGEPVSRSLGELPRPVELVVIATPAAGFGQAVDEALAVGARAIVAITAGLGEMGADGRRVERAAVERVRAAGAILVGPNCLGIVDTGTSLDLASQEMAPGSVGLITQSGNLGLELALLAQEAQVGLSRFVSLGNQADLEAGELIRAFIDHEPTRVIAVYLEDFRDGRALARDAEAAIAAGKPVVLLTVGSSRAGAESAFSHTGALVSDSVAVDAACRATGMLRVSTPRAMIALAQALLAPHRPPGRRVAVVGDGGGHVALAADLLTAAGLDVVPLSDALAGAIAADLPSTASTKNPVDLAGGGEQDFSNYARVVRRLSGSSEVDAILLTGYFGGYSTQSDAFAARETEVARAMAGAAAEAGCALVVQTMYPGTESIRALRQARIPVYADVGAAVESLARIAAPTRPARAHVAAIPPPRRAEVRAGDYFAARQLVAAAGIPLIDAHPARTAEEAVTAAQSLGYPVVLKSLADSHKSEAGGVRIGIPDAGALRAAIAAMARRRPPGFSVERMADVPAGIELLIGVRWDRAFGPIALVGMGGVYAELLHDVEVALAPLDPDAAEALIRSLEGAPLLEGARSRPPLDIRAAAQALSRLSSFVAERPGLTELEVNPLLVLRDGVVALDARAVAAPVS
ncbi:MAG TPA: acetate--CoA ligase family protein [Candidatus Limnocylindrales bacterium]|nr:acetate--CoA ligase family protein [Candidatus Limnocylindrales bacterium]